MHHARPAARPTYALAVSQLPCAHATAFDMVCGSGTLASKALASRCSPIVVAEQVACLLIAYATDACTGYPSWTVLWHHTVQRLARGPWRCLPCLGVWGATGMPSL